MSATILMNAREDVQKVQITDSALPPRIGLEFLKSIKVIERLKLDTDFQTGKRIHQ